jgi:hypothetical protein
MPAIDAGGAPGAGAIYPLDSISAGSGGTYTSAKSYLEMIVLKIGTKRRYPEEAKGLGEQGREGGCLYGNDREAASGCSD